MIIRNTSPGRFHLGFCSMGVWLNPNQTHEIDDSIVENETFRRMENEGKLAIVSFGPDHTRYAVRQELGGELLGDVTRTSGIHFDPENVSRESSFVYKLSPLPLVLDEVVMFVDALRMKTTDFTVLEDGTIEWLIGADYDVENTDEISFHYASAG